MVFLHQQLGLDVRLVKFHAYRTGSGEILVTVSNFYPPPEVEEFVLSPAVAERQAQRSQAGKQQREVSTVKKLLESGVLADATRLTYVSPAEGETAVAVETWLQGDAHRRSATWQPRESAT